MTMLVRLQELIPVRGVIGGKDVPDKHSTIIHPDKSFQTLDSEAITMPNFEISGKSLSLRRFNFADQMFLQWNTWTVQNMKLRKYPGQQDCQSAARAIYPEEEVGGCSVVFWSTTHNHHP